MQPFISTGDLGNYLGEDVTDSELATIAIDSACEIIRSYLGQRLNYLADDVVMLDGNLQQTLLLPQRPIVDVTAVSEDGTELTGTDFMFTRSGILHRVGSFWSAGIQNIEVTYSHGYAVLESDVEDDPTDEVFKPDRMPADIRRVALSLAQRIFVSSGTVIGTKSSETIGPDSYSYTLANTTGTSAVSNASEIGSDEMAILAPHRLVGVG